MFIKDTKKEFYEYVISSRSRLLVYVSYDLDSISATKILQYLLECDHILHTIVPIRDKQELFRSFKDHSTDGLKAVLLINIGLTFDVLDFLNPEPTVRIFICDSRRPIDVYNAYNDKQISILSAISGLNSVESETKGIPKYETLFCESDSEEEEVERMSVEQLERRKDRRKWEDRRRALLFEYLQFTYCSYSSALLMFDLSWKLSKDNNELLWFAIIGVSDQLINGKTNESKFGQQFQYIREAMTRLRNLRGDPTIALNNIGTNGEQNVVTNHNHLTISYEKELKLCLYRHWSLYESLRHTMYISSKFKIWKLRGHKRLLAFLAELGLPLTQCKQKFSSMDLELRTNVKQWIEDLSSKYQLQQIIGHSFVANRGFKHKYNCNDAAFASRALLESADRDKRLNQKFFDAIDCLSSNNIDLLEKGLDSAKLQLSAILKQVQIIVDARQICLLNDILWYTIIPESTPDANLFCYSGCLNLLAQYVLHALAATNPKSKKSIRLPLIIITPNPNKPGMSMACGIPPINSIHNGLNFFSTAYTQIKDKLKECPIEHDLVDPCVAHLPYNQAMNFLNELSLLLH